MKRTLLTTLFLSLFACATSLFALDGYVSNGMRNTGADSDTSSTYSTLQLAIDNAQSGDVLYIVRDNINAGSPRGDFSMKSNITLTTDPALAGTTHARINGNSGNSTCIEISSNAENIVIKNINFFRHNFGLNIKQEAGAGINNIVIDNCYFSNRAADSSAAHASIQLHANNTAKLNNIFISNCSFQEVIESPAIYIRDGVSNVVFANCTFASNAGVVFAIDTAIGGGAKDVLITNCTFISNNTSDTASTYTIDIQTGDVERFSVVDSSFSSYYANELRAINTLVNNNALDILVDGCTFTGYTTAISVDVQNTTIQNATFISNTTGIEGAWKNNGTHVFSNYFNGHETAIFLSADLTKQALRPTRIYSNLIVNCDQGANGIGIKVDKTTNVEIFYNTISNTTSHAVRLTTWRASSDITMGYNNLIDFAVNNGSAISRDDQGIGSFHTGINYYGMRDYAGGWYEGTSAGETTNVRALSYLHHEVRIPAQPTNVTASVALGGEIVISWDAVDGADGYLVTRGGSSASNDNFTTVIGGATVTTYTDATTSSYATYHYAVTAYSNVGGGNSNEGWYSAIVEITDPYVMNTNTGVGYPSLNNAIIAASEGDTIIVLDSGRAQGDYYVNNKKNITITTELSECIIDGAANHGIRIRNSEGIVISGLTFTNCVNAIDAADITNCVFSNNAFVFNTNEVILIDGAGSTGNLIADNLIASNESDGIRLWTGVTNTVVSNNVIHDNLKKGVYGYGADKTFVIGNTVYSNNLAEHEEGAGVYLYNCNNAVANYNTVTGDKEVFGITVEPGASYGHEVVGNLVRNVTNIGINFEGGNVVIALNTVTNNYVGIRGYNKISNAVVVSNSACDNTTHGIYLETVLGPFSGAVVETNYVIGNSNGVYIDELNNASVRCNTISNNDLYGLRFEGNNGGTFINVNNICFNTTNLSRSYSGDSNTTLIMGTNYFGAAGNFFANFAESKLGDGDKVLEKVLAWSPSLIGANGDWELPPAATSVVAATNGGDIRIVWASNTAADWKEYRIYRESADDISNVTSGVHITENGSVATLYRDDAGAASAECYYYITVVDANDNETFFTRAEYIAPAPEVLGTPAVDATLEGTNYLFTFTGSYRHILGIGPDAVVAVIRKGLTTERELLMTNTDGGTAYISGEDYAYTLQTSERLASGDYTYTIRFTNGGTNSGEGTPISFTVNNAARLTDYVVSNSAGSATGDGRTAFTYAVKYTDDESDAPQFVNVVISNTLGSAWTNAMTYNAGSIYTFTTNLSFIGTESYAYYMYTSDSGRPNATNVMEGIGASNENTPVITNSVAQLSVLAHSPLTGNAETNFTLTVSYDDIDGDAPTNTYGVKIWISNVDSNTAVVSGEAATEGTGDYTNGMTYTYTFDPSVGGTYAYFFRTEGEPAGVVTSAVSNFYVTPDDAPTIEGLNVLGVDAVEYALSFAYTIADTNGDAMDVSFEYRPQSGSWTNIAASNITTAEGEAFAGTNLGNGRYTNLWYVPTDIDTNATYELRVTVASRALSTNGITTVTRTHLKKFFPTTVPSLVNPVVLNNPARRSEPVVFVNIPAQTRIRVYTVSGMLVTELTPQSTGRVEWDLSQMNIAPGIYIVHFLAPDGATAVVRKIVLAD